MKVRSIEKALTLTDVPNIGKSIAGDLGLIGIKEPLDLKKKDPLKLYKALCKKMNAKIDPCVLDTLMAAVDFANGAEARKWWHYTKERKQRFKI